MDEINIRSGFMKGIVAKAIAKKLRQKTGYGADIHLNNFTTTVTDGKAHVHLDIEADMDRTELLRLLKAVDII